MSIEARVREIAREVGIEPDDAMRMDFVDFARTVAVHRALRDSERIAISVMARGKRAAGR